MKVLGINGSARRNGNTALMLREVFKVLEENGIETELVELGGERIRGCQACDLCAERKDGRCAISDDCVNSMIEKRLPPTE
ncbi:MAG: flavodoxin family protein [Thermoplasmatota archaeon]